MKTYKIYFRHYDRVLTVEAEHFAIENGVVTFYADGKPANADLYILLDAVGAIEAEVVTPMDAPVSSGVKLPSSMMSGF